jgi:hypothetical protein
VEDHALVVLDARIEASDTQITRREPAKAILMCREDILLERVSREARHPIFKLY